MMAIILWCYFLQRWWQFRGHSSHKGHPDGLRKSGMEAARHLSLFVRDGRRVFPLRRTDMCHEIWLVDLRWLPGHFLFYLFSKIDLVFFSHPLHQKDTRKYLLRGYILGTVTHTTAWDQHWGDNETLKWVLTLFHTGSGMTLSHEQGLIWPLPDITY